MLRSALLATSLLILGDALHAANPTDAALARRFNQTVRPFVTSYCPGCHTGSTPAAGLDLNRYSTME